MNIPKDISLGFTIDENLPVFFWGGLSLDQAMDRYTEFVEELPNIQVLGENLLSIGGYRACMAPSEENTLNIHERGELWLGHGSKRVAGLPSSCHANAAIYYLQHARISPDTLEIVTGYALSDDGLWRQHTWCVQKQSNEDTLVIETTLERVAYFGFRLTKDESIQFARECLPPEVFLLAGLSLLS